MGAIYVVDRDERLKSDIQFPTRSMVGAPLQGNEHDASTDGAGNPPSEAAGSSSSGVLLLWDVPGDLHRESKASSGGGGGHRTGQARGHGLTSTDDKEHSC